MAFPATFLDLQNSVIDKLRLEADLDRDKAKDWLNRAYFRAAVETEFLEASTASTALTANQASVDVPTELVVVDWIVTAGSDGAQWPPMELVSLEEILQNRAWAMGAQPLGAPTRYAWRSASTPTIEIWPNANGGEILTFYGAELPAALSADGDTPIFPEPYGSDVLEYGACILAGERQKDILMLQNYQSAYQDALQRFRAFTNSRIGDRTQQLQVARQRPYPKGNSVDSPYNW